MVGYLGVCGGVSWSVWWGILIECQRSLVLAQAVSTLWATMVLRILVSGEGVVEHQPTSLDHTLHVVDVGTNSLAIVALCMFNKESRSKK